MLLQGRGRLSIQGPKPIRGRHYFTILTHRRSGKFRRLVALFPPLRRCAEMEEAASEKAALDYIRNRSPGNLREVWLLQMIQMSRTRVGRAFAARSH